MTERHGRHTSISSLSPSRSQSADPIDTDSGREDTSSGSSNKPKTKTNGASKKHLTPDHFDFMLDWLERPGNYARVFGASGKTTIGGKETKNASVAFDEWAKHVSKAGSFLLTGANLRARFTRHLGKYKEIKRNEKAKGYGLTEEDYNNKIRTLAEKYEKECHSFERMDRIFGNKPDVHALASMEGGAGTTLKVQGALVDFNVFDYSKDDDGTVVGQVEDIALSVEDNHESVQDETFTIEDYPLDTDEGADEVDAAPIGPTKRPAVATAENNRDKRSKTSVERIPLLRVNVETPQGKGASFSHQLFEQMEANAKSTYSPLEIVELDTQSNPINFPLLQSKKK
ncbi:hypothetical protein EC991_005445 [Linnemannia zychae]|nr:hypothetical protein EC991_005445 [Linnemannia zychae]